MITVGHTHLVELIQDGEPVLTRDVKVAGGVVEVLDLGGEEEPPDAETEQPEVEPAEQETSSLDVAGWILLGTGGALLAGGGVVGGLALKQSKTLEDACPGGGCSPDACCSG